jgi:flagellar hook-associated protein 3 FlgL
MVRMLDSATERFLDDLRAANSRMERAQREVSSGRRLATAGDAPDSVAALTQVRADLSRLSQTRSNLDRVKTEADTAEAALQQSVKLMDRVRTLGMTGASGIQTALTRESIAGELGTILERMVGLANSEVDGRFIFSGDADQAPAFTIDFADSPPWSNYLGSPATRRALHPTGVTFATSKDAGEVFDNTDPTKNVFESIEAMRQSLLANNDDALQAALAPLAQVSAHLNAMLSSYGNVQTEIDEGIDTGEKLRLQLEARRATLEDADLTTSILELNQTEFQRDAALQVRGAIPRRSLFDYLG